MISRQLQTLLYAILLATFMGSVSATCAGARVTLDAPAPNADAAKPFLGRWDLTLKAPDREYP
ncbi:MAG: hypothetical protein WCA47_11710, partial [Terriglobales bacterium]